MKFLCVFCVLLALTLDFSAGLTTYLGCFNDDNANLDLDDLELRFATGSLTVEDCVSQCQLNGHPYAGVRRSTVCYCGNDYGRHGVAADHPIDCNYTCGGLYCGGNDANSIYYVVDPEDDTSRSFYAYGDMATFSTARSTCVSTNGDLATARDSYNFNESVVDFGGFVLTDNQRQYWLGMRHRCGIQTCTDTDHECNDFQWIDANNTDFFSCTDNPDVWVTGENWQNLCVVVNMTTGKWETTSCYAQYPFLCFSARREDEESEEEEYNPTVKDEKVDDSKTRIALFIVLPFFFFCYGGSCLLYCIHKAYKNCRRRRRRNMLLERQDSFTEFEPDTKPQSKSVIMVAGKKGGLGDGPVVESKPESVLTKKGSAFSLTSSDAVRIDVTTPPGSGDADDVPGYYKKNVMRDKINKIRAEKRRAKLLENALMEARQRRAKEGEGNESPAIMVAPASSQEGAPPTPGNRRSRMNRYKPSSAGEINRDASDSKASLLDDDRKTESPDDPTTMSIADIMRVKMMMKEKKKRVRKILLS